MAAVGRIITFKDLKATDCYCTPDWTLKVIRACWGGTDFDPFWDPECRTKPRSKFDIRKGQDAYEDPWPIKKKLKIFANGPYSGSNPAETARLCMEAAEAGAYVMNLCPAAAGSDYWWEYVWPRKPAVAWLGRLSFRAGRTIKDKHGEIVAHKGEIIEGNRTEIALVFDAPKTLQRKFQKQWNAERYHVSLAA
jgi:hypothetical protein